MFILKKTLNLYSHCKPTEEIQEFGANQQDSWGWIWVFPSGDFSESPGKVASMALRCFKRLLRSSSDTSLKRWPCVRWGDPSDGVRLDFGNTKGKDINQISNILLIHMRIHQKLRESGEYRKPIHKRSIPQTNKQKRNNSQQWKNRVFLFDTTKKTE